MNRMNRNRRAKRKREFVNANETSSQDYSYGEGREQDLVERLHSELGKSKHEIVRMMTDMY